MFHVETINVYDHYGLEKEQNMAGNLTCMYHATSATFHVYIIG